jgi:hypothetical protein
MVSTHNRPPNAESTKIEVFWSDTQKRRAKSREMHRKFGAAVFVSWENSGIFSPDRLILIWEPHDEREQKIPIDTPLGSRVMCLLI